MFRELAKRFQGLFPSRLLQTRGPEKRPLVVSRPARLPQEYLLSYDSGVAEAAFLRLKDNVFRILDEATVGGVGRAAPMFREHGRIGEDRSYFFVKPPNERGWLFERSETGWTIVRSEKIVGEDLFVRGRDIWDSISVYTAAGDQSAPPRVQSQVLGKELLSLPVYQHKLVREMLLQQT